MSQQSFCVQKNLTNLKTIGCSYLISHKKIVLFKNLERIFSVARVWQLVISNCLKYDTFRNKYLADGSYLIQSC